MTAPSTLRLRSIFDLLTERLAAVLKLAVKQFALDATEARRLLVRKA